MSSFTAKAALKAARAALEARNYEDASIQAEKVLAIDNANYYAHVFLGRALEKQSRIPEAASAYRSGTQLKPEEETAWKGLCSLYEASKDVTGFLDASINLAEQYANRGDLHQSQSTVDKAVSFAREHGTLQQLKSSLGLYLPSSPVFEALQGRIQAPALTYRRLAELTDTEDTEKINREIGDRRLRLGVKLSQVSADVRREVYEASNLESLLEAVVSWSHDDDERLEFEEKLLLHAYEHLTVLSEDLKAKKRARVIDLSRGMVILKRVNQLAWHIELEWHESATIDEHMRNLLVQYCQLFPGSALTAAVEGWLGLEVNPAAAIGKEQGTESQLMDNDRQLTLDERLSRLARAQRSSQSSPLTWRLATEFYLEINEHEAAAEAARHALELLHEQCQISGLRLQQLLDATRVMLGTALVFYQSPRNHPEALSLFNAALAEQQSSVHALLGVGLIYEERHDFKEAAAVLNRAQALNPTAISISAEAAWCQFLSGDLDDGLRRLQECLAIMNSDEKTPSDLKGKTSYRVGKCLWEQRIDKASRKDRKGPYAFFISSLKASPTFAPGYTALGIYYADYSKDRTRARQCFQKAFELSSTELTAAKRLAHDFAKAAEWDIVEIISKRAIDSGVARPAPGSKRQAVSWPWSALAMVHLSRQEYPQAVHSYHAALRISSDDYNSWVGLGESYLRSGRYSAASRVLDHAQGMPSRDDDRWYAQYLQANVLRELGNYEQAVASYRDVLKLRHQESGVSMALLQTLVESSQDLLSRGFFALALKRAEESIAHAQSQVAAHRGSVNFWRAVGDSMAILASLVNSEPSTVHFERAQSILRDAGSDEMLASLEALDGIKLKTLSQDSDATNTSGRSRWLIMSILAQKHAVLAAASDANARSVAWYNLGWTELLASAFSSSADVGNSFQGSAKAATKCLKQAIEIEPGNALLWAALGVSTIPFSPAVSQHCFVRSLHLDENNPETWVALGALYFQQSDFDLAVESFARAKAIDPDCTGAWFGEGMLAQVEGNFNAATTLFDHALEISTAADLALKKYYVALTSTQHGKLLSDPASVNRSLFAIQQLRVQPWNALQHQHMEGLLQERVGNYHAAQSCLSLAANQVEELFERTEETSTLMSFANLKSDLARCRMALGNFEASIEDATAALDLTEGTESTTEVVRSRLRLSAHLSAGISQHSSNYLAGAVAMYRAALDESDSQPDVICSLARVLWARGSVNERSVAKEQLFRSLQTNVAHTDSMMLLAAMSLLGGDDETTQDLLTDLRLTRCDGCLTQEQNHRIGRLLITSAIAAGHREEGELQRAICLNPEDPAMWSSFGGVSDDERLLVTAHETAKASANDCNGVYAAESLSSTCLSIHTARSVQTSVMVAPWDRRGWLGLGMALSV